MLDSITLIAKKFEILDTFEQSFSNLLQEEKDENIKISIIRIIKIIREQRRAYYNEVLVK